MSDFQFAQPQNYQSGPMIGSAQDAAANLTRQQWYEYVNNFQPFEQDLINYATDPQQVQRNMDMAREHVSQSFDNQQGITQRRLKGYGINLNQDEQKAIGREQNLSRSIADVNAANMARRGTVNQQMGIIGAPAPAG